MKRTRTTEHGFPKEIAGLTVGADVYDSSSSHEARVWLIDRDGGFFIKRSAPGTLLTEYRMTDYFYSLDLGAKVELYKELDGYDWLITKRIPGEDSTHFLDDPKRLAELIGKKLGYLHSLDYNCCPVKNRCDTYLNSVKSGYLEGRYDEGLFFGDFTFKTRDEAYRTVEDNAKYFKTDTLLHGDYCLPNIILNNWEFSGFIDLGCGGVGDRHIDLFWGAWTLRYNLGTDKYRDIFFDAYGRNKFEPEMLRIIAAAECFG